MSTAQHHRHKRRKQFHRKSSGAMCTPRRGLLYAQCAQCRRIQAHAPPPSRPYPLLPKPLETAKTTKNMFAFPRTWCMVEIENDNQPCSEESNRV